MLSVTVYLLVDWYQSFSHILPRHLLCICWLLCIGSSSLAQLLGAYKSGPYSENWAESDRQRSYDGVTHLCPHVSVCLGIWWEISNYYILFRITSMYLRNVLHGILLSCNNTLTIWNYKDIKCQISSVLNFVLIMYDHCYSWLQVCVQLSWWPSLHPPWLYQ